MTTNLCVCVHVYVCACACACVCDTCMCACEQVCVWFPDHCTLTIQQNLMGLGTRRVCVCVVGGTRKEREVGEVNQSFFSVP